jgi:hypothetical protein
MYIEIGTEGGFVIQSLTIDRKEMQAQIDAAKGKIFHGVWANNVCKTVDEFLVWLRDLAMNKEVDGMDPTEISIDTFEGKVTIQPSKIVYFKVVE